MDAAGLCIVGREEGEDDRKALSRVDLGAFNEHYSNVSHPGQELKEEPEGQCWSSRLVAEEIHQTLPEDALSTSAFSQEHDTYHSPRHQQNLHQHQQNHQADAHLQGLRQTGAHAAATVELSHSDSTGSAGSVKGASSLRLGLPLHF